MATVDSVTWLAQDEGDAEQKVTKYLVVFTDATATVDDARTADDGTTAIPTQGSRWADSELFANVSAAQRPDDPTHWDVTVTYSAKQKENSTGGGGGSIWGVQVSRKQIEYQRPVTRDKDNEKITNTAGQPFPEPAMYTDYDNLWSISYITNDPTIFGKIESVRGIGNSDEITLSYRGMTKVFGVGKIKLVGDNISLDSSASEYEPAFAVSLEIHERLYDEWYDVELANMGYRNILGKPNTDANGQELTTPSYLDADGFFCDDTAEPTEPVKRLVQARVAYTPILGGL